jgi:hypothetical protein
MCGALYHRPGRVTTVHDVTHRIANMTRACFPTLTI